MFIFIKILRLFATSWSKSGHQQFALAPGYLNENLFSLSLACAAGVWFTMHRIQSQVQGYYFRKYQPYRWNCTTVRGFGAITIRTAWSRCVYNVYNVLHIKPTGTNKWPSGHLMLHMLVLIGMRHHSAKIRPLSRNWTGETGCDEKSNYTAIKKH